ncbi:rolling circle replication-associated protein [Pseudomonas moraviensis]|uniref:rolling circle replication-associated protein n=1 Tax=Pseudomonas moraviensis TaxID=321662 RepID=UPI003D1BD38A
MSEAAPDPDGVGWTLRDDECPLSGALAFDRTTGEVAWRPTCKNARCRRCSRQVSAQTFALARRAVEDQERLRFVTLTRAPEGWQETRQAMRVWRENLQRHGVAGEGLWVVERGSETGMKHVHVVQHGPRKIPMDVLDDSWSYGSTQVESARAAVDYLGKGVMRYVAKGLDEGEETLTEHMDINGGRAAHWSTGFFDGTGRNAYRAAHPLPGVYFVQTAR